MKYAPARRITRNREAAFTPVITFGYKRLEAGLSRGAKRPLPDRATVLSALGDFGCAIEGDPNGDTLSVEALMNRPDLFSVEGIARALRPFLGLAEAPTYPVSKGKVEVIVDPSVLAIRPEIASAVVRGVVLDDEGLASLLDTQEKLDLTYGRRRARVSIGLHALGRLTPPITYKAAAPSSASFVPLFADTLPGGARPLTLSEILALHPKGVEYAPLLAGKDAYPLLVDSKGAVLSMPPIINGTLTQLTPGRHDIFLDVTGTARAPVLATARLIAMLLAERGGTIEGVEVRRPHEPTSLEPDLGSATRPVSVASASALVGAPLRAAEVATALERMGFRASIAPGGTLVEAAVPPWRFDLLHEVDLIEDVAIGLGYRNVPGSLPRLPTIGSEEAMASVVRRSRAVMLGLGFLEAMTLTLTSPDDANVSPIDHPGASPTSGEVPSVHTIANPIARDHSVLRTSLLPSLMNVLASNTHRDLPQALFEVGDAVLLGQNTRTLACVFLGSDASFTRAKGLAIALSNAFSLPHHFVEAGASPFFTQGRAALLRVDDKPCGAFGEVAPSVLARHGLAHPAFALELRLGALAVAFRGTPKPPGEITSP